MLLLASAFLLYPSLSLPPSRLVRPLKPSAVAFAANARIQSTSLQSSSSSYASSRSPKRQRSNLIPQCLIDFYRNRLCPTNPFLQSTVLILFYVIHTKFLMTHELPIFPGIFVPCDVILGGTISLLIVLYYSVNGVSLLEKVWNESPVPWRRPRQHPTRTFFIITSIIFLYYFAGALSIYLPLLLDIMANFIPMTVPLQKSLHLFIGHLLWVLPSASMLLLVDRFYNIKPKGRKTIRQEQVAKFRIGERDQSLRYGVPLNTNTFAPVKRYGRRDEIWKSKRKGISDWFSISTKSGDWIWHVMIGYTVSVFVFYMSDLVNTRTLPRRFFFDNELVVDIRSKKSFGFAYITGLLAPCITAPIWEEIFYRGLIYPWLSSVFPLKYSTPLVSLIFAGQHFRPDSFVPLYFLGTLWSMIYVLSQNLLVPIVVHAMWNLRIFMAL